MKVKLFDSNTVNYYDNKIDKDSIIDQFINKYYKHNIALSDSIKENK
jgi:hypothetical protein